MTAERIPERLYSTIHLIVIRDRGYRSSIKTREMRKLKRLICYCRSRRSKYLGTNDEPAPPEVEWERIYMYISLQIYETWQFYSL